MFSRRAAPPPGASFAGIGGNEGPGELDPLLGSAAARPAGKSVRWAQENAGYEDPGYEDPRKKRAQTIRLFLSMVFVPWICFIVSLLLFMFVYKSGAAVLIPTTGFACGMLLLLALASSCNRKFDEGYVLFLVAFSIAAGASAGQYIFSDYLQHYSNFYQGRHYTNVWPDESAAAHRDATVIVFAEGAKPDVTKSLGYNDGHHITCVAPITVDRSSEVETEVVQYWAAGSDCCNEYGSFTCDESSNKLARSGIVISPESHFLDNWGRNYFIQSIRMAEAKYGMTSTETPIFVRWFYDLDTARTYFLTKTLVSTFGAIIGYFAFSAVAILAAPRLLFGALHTVLFPNKGIVKRLEYVHRNNKATV